MAKTFTVEDFLERRGIAPSSLQEYRSAFSSLEQFLGKPLAQATDRDLVKLKKKLQGMKSGYHRAALLRMFYRAAGQPEKAPLLKIKRQVHRMRPDDVLTPGDVQALLAASRSTRDRALLGCLWDTGGRIHELLAVRLKDVKERASPENGGRKIYVLWFGKSKISGEEHEAYLLQTAPLMETWLKGHPDPRSEAYLFPTWDGNHMDRKNAWKIVHRAALRAKLGKKVHPHLFRHSCATHLLRLGVPEAQVKQLLGWVPGSNMLNRYQHLTGEDAYRALLKSQGLALPEPMDLGKLALDSENLRPVVPMNPPPGLGRESEVERLRKELEETKLEMRRFVVETLQSFSHGRSPPAEQGGQ